MPFIIDAHEDLAYNGLSFGRDYCCSAAEIRQREKGSRMTEASGQALVGWPDMQRGQIAMVFGTLFILPKKYLEGEWELGQSYSTTEEGGRLYRQQVDYYRRLCESNPDKFSLICNQDDMAAVLKAWDDAPASYPDVTHPVGLVMLMESAEGIREPRELEEYWEMGLRLVGPVWGGFRFCGGSAEPGSFTKEGYELLDVMADIGFPLDISHMNEISALQALDSYDGTIIATHGNARTLLKEDPRERLFSDDVLRRLFERDGIVGVVPFNRFLNSDWKKSDARSTITLDLLVNHIDHMCQLAGNSKHVGLGTDFDGGFGWPEVPFEIDTIGDMQQLVDVLKARGYEDSDIEGIMAGNWRRFLELNLPRR